MQMSQQLMYTSLQHLNRIYIFIMVFVCFLNMLLHTLALASALKMLHILLILTLKTCISVYLNMCKFLIKIYLNLRNEQGCSMFVTLYIPPVPVGYRLERWLHWLLGTCNGKITASFSIMYPSSILYYHTRNNIFPARQRECNVRVMQYISKFCFLCFSCNLIQETVRPYPVDLQTSL